MNGSPKTNANGDLFGKIGDTTATTLSRSLFFATNVGLHKQKDWACGLQFRFAWAREFTNVVSKKP